MFIDKNVNIKMLIYIIIINLKFYNVEMNGFLKNTRIYK